MSRYCVFTLEKDSVLLYIGAVKPRIPPMRHLLFSLLLIVSLSRGQEISISLSPEIDTLSARLLRNPDDRSLQLQLIDAYTLSFNPELALLELLNAEADGKLVREGVGIKGTVQLSLEQTAAAFSSLTQAYLSAPSDETLLLIAVVEYARGESQRGYWEISRLKQRVPDLSVKLLGLYERFYLNGRRTIARAIARALQDVDQVAYEAYFPVPLVSVLSPSDNFATEASQVSVVFEVRHNRPIQTVRIGEATVYDRGEWRGGSANEAFSRSYTNLFTLQEGRNPIVIRATDIFGNESRDTVFVSGMNFNRLASWRSPLVDTLRKNLRYLQNYVPDSILIVGQRNVMRGLIIAGSSSADSTDLFDRGMFLHEFLTHPISGLIPPDNSKILVQHRVEEHTMMMVLDDWLLKGATFQNVTVVYCGGDWNISEAQWLLRDRKGGSVDIKPYAERLRSLATAGIIFIADGSVDNRSLFEAGLRRLAEGATVPLEVVILPGGGAWPAQLSEATLNPSSMGGRAEGLAILNTAALQTDIPGTIVIRGEHTALPAARNPAAVIGTVSERMVAALSKKLSREKIDDSVRRKILAFSADWRRYNEIARYLSDQFSIADFVVRVEEYERRSGGAK